MAADLGHICAQSKLGAIVEEERIPTSKRFQEYCERFNQDSRHLSLHVGEDYVLLGTVPRESVGELEEALTTQGCGFHQIGETSAELGLKLRDRNGSIEEIGATGWDHFR